MGLKAADHSTQIVPAEYLLDYLHTAVSALGVLASAADDIRHLQRTEIAEVGEAFDERQVGSSTMPHKRNPWNFEHVKSLWKTFMPRMATVYMDQLSEHQRDLTNSASGRFYGEIVFGLAAAARRMTRVCKRLVVDRERMRKNFELTRETVIAEPLYILLAAADIPTPTKPCGPLRFGPKGREARCGPFWRRMPSCARIWRAAQSTAAAGLGGSQLVRRQGEGKGAGGSASFGRSDWGWRAPAGKGAARRRIQAADGPQYPRRGPSGPGRSRGAAVRMKFEELTIEQIEAHKAWRRMGLTDDEHRRIAELLGRPPNWTELGMFSVLWSEHCAYKHSRALFPLFPTDGPQILQGPGENAGVVDIGDGWAVVFKIESHNHPSAIDPYQGAATGVGGILRDIFAMGARPVAVLNSLRLGPLEDERARELLKGIVSGIAGYGNVAGVPTVGGEIGFDASFQGNPLVNAMAVGIVRHEMVMRASAEGVGNPVMAVGARTGRDGIHGAGFASAELSEGSDEGLPQVQVGDPHIGKRLIEACLELYETGLVVGVQDMGAAGLTSSSCEMASRAGSGIELNLDAVPLREEGMTPYEIMLSESQERMLVVPERGAEERVQEIFRKWGLEAAVVGRVTDDGMLRVYSRGQCVAEAPAKALSTDGAPMYHPEAKEPERLKELWQTPLPDGPVADPGDRLRELLASPNIAQKAWVYEQFDYKAGGAAVLAPGRADAAVIRVEGAAPAAWPSPPTATAFTAISIPTKALGTPWPRRPGIWSALEPSRWPSPTE